jgi:hypothetical protein
MALALDAKRPDGKPLFDYWVGVEGVYNMLELYQAALAGQAASPFVAQIKEDMETETGGTPLTQPEAYRERTVVLRASDIIKSGVKGVILIHAREDGLALYPQAQELAQALRSGGVPTDFYTVGSRAPGDDPDTTLAGYTGMSTGQAGHGSEVSEHHVVIDQGFIRASGLIAGDPPPCDRNFQVEGSPRSVTPDPSATSPTCAAGEPIAAGCTPGAPKLKRVRARNRSRLVRASGVVRPDACDPSSARLRVIARGGGHRVVRRLSRAGRFSIPVPGNPRCIRVRAVDRGRATTSRCVRVKSARRGV